MKLALLALFAACTQAVVLKQKLVKTHQVEVPSLAQVFGKAGQTEEEMK